MTTYHVGYFVGSLARHAINRPLARTLERVAPAALSEFEIPFKDPPPYNREFRRNYLAEFHAFFVRVKASCSPT
jgi:chromate reductase